MTWTLIAIFFVGGLEYGRMEMTGWETIAQCEAAGYRVTASVPPEVTTGPVSIRIQCDAQP